MSTEVQKIPGVFNLPSNWPKVQFPRIDEGIILDWSADDLALGNLSSWTDRKSGKALKLAPSFDAPVVEAGPNGHKAVKFDARTKLIADVTNFIPQNTSIAVVYNVDPTCSTAARLLSGQSGFRTWSPGTSSKMNLNSTAKAGLTPLGTITSGPIVKGTWQSTATRYISGKEIYARTLNGAGVTGVMAAGDIDQQVFIVGYNTSGVIGGETSDPGYKGLIARIVVWDHALNDVDIDAYLAVQKNTYLLP